MSNFDDAPHRKSKIPPSDPSAFTNEAPTQTDTATPAPAGRISPAFHYPIPREHTGKLQFAINRAATVEVERIGVVRRAEVIRVKNAEFARGLTAGGQFANAPADAPLGQPDAYSPRPKAEQAAQTLTDDGTAAARPDLGVKVGDFQAPRGDETPLASGVTFDFNANPPTASFDATPPASTKKSTK